MKAFGRYLLASLMLLAAAGAAKATPLVNLGLVIDSSGSIGSTNFNTVKTGYYNALSTLPIDGTVAVTVDNFSSYNQSQTYADTLIGSQTDLNGLLSFINGLTYYGGLTALSDAIYNTANVIAGSGLGAPKNVIDVSTDGYENDSTHYYGNAPAASAYALSQGIDQVNCLGIGLSANCNFQAGVGSFSYQNVSYNDFGTILAQKIQRETTIPDPSTIALLGIGLASLGFSRRKRIR